MSYLQYKIPPYIHQRTTLELSKDREYWAYFMETGLGKTSVALVQAAYLWNCGKIKQCLFISKNGVDQQIIDEAVPVHLPLRENEYFAECWHESGAWRKFDKFKKTLENSLIILGLNCEALGTKKGLKACRDLAVRAPTLLIVDESQDFGGSTATRTKNLLSIAPLFPYRRIMSGTPSGGNPLHYYPQMRILSPSIFPVDLWGFKARYCIVQKEGIWIKDKKTGAPIKKFFDTVKGYRNLDGLQQIVGQYSSRVTKSECPDLPPKIYKKSTFELSADERTLYNKVKSSVLAELAPGKYISAEMAITKLIRLQQIACGFVVFEDLITGEKGKHLLETPSRMVRLLEICAQLEGKTLIWSRFTLSTEHIVNSLSKVYGSNAVVRYDGTVSSADKQANKRAFKESKDVRFFVGNPKAGGVGLDLPEATNAVYYSNDHSLISRLQSEDRCHRIISKYPVTYVDLVANKTVDDKILTALKARYDIASQLTGDQLRKWIE